MIGIYKFQNKINNKVYIGQSVNIKQRKYQHFSSAYNEKANDYNSQFHQALRKYGVENFSFEILEEFSSEEYSKEKLNEKEIYWISYYDSFKNGYNATPGGNQKDNELSMGENNGRALLSRGDVEYIRECYNAHIPFRQVYSEYKDKISKRGLQKVWNFENWKDIHPEYYNEENRYWHSHNAKANPYEVARNNKRGFSKEEVLFMRKLYYQDKIGPGQIWKQYFPDKAKGTVYNAIMKKTYKDIE